MTPSCARVPRADAAINGGICISAAPLLFDRLVITRVVAGDADERRLLPPFNGFEQLMATLKSMSDSDLK